MNSIVGNSKSKSMVEKTAQVIFTVCAFFAVLAVISITAYMIISGTPALSQVGIAELLFGTVWKPTAADPSYGILYVILTSIVGTTMAIILGVQTPGCHRPARHRTAGRHSFRHLRAAGHHAPLPCHV